MSAAVKTEAPMNAVPRILVAAVLPLLCSCVSVSQVDDYSRMLKEQDVEIRIFTYGQQDSPDWQRLPPRSAVVTLEGVACTLRNDKKTWELVAPGIVTVDRSPGQLAIECSKDGFQPVHTKLTCVNRKALRAQEGVVGFAISSGPAIVAITPASLGLLALGGALAFDKGAVAPTPRPDDDVCDYVTYVSFFMSAKKDPYR